MTALKQPTIRVVAIIAEGVPEADTKQLIAFARANNKVNKDRILLTKFYYWIKSEWFNEGEYPKVYALVISITWPVEMMLMQLIALC